MHGRDAVVSASCVQVRGALGVWMLTVPRSLGDREMFRDARSFNCDLSSWDVSNVTNMRQVWHVRASLPSINLTHARAFIKTVCKT